MAFPSLIWLESVASTEPIISCLLANYLLQESYNIYSCFSIFTIDFLRIWDSDKQTFWEKQRRSSCAKALLSLAEQRNWSGIPLKEDHIFLRLWSAVMGRCFCEQGSVSGQVKWWFASHSASVATISNAMLWVPEKRSVEVLFLVVIPTNYTAIRNIGLGGDRGLQTGLYHGPSVWRGGEVWAETLVGAVVEERRSSHFGKEARTVAGEAQTPAPSLHTLSCSQTRTVCSQHNKSQKEASVCKSALRTPSGDTPHPWPGSCSFCTNQSLLVEVFVKGWRTVIHWHGIHGLREVNFLTVHAGLNVVAVWRSQWNAYLRQMPEDVLIAPCANVRFLLFRKLSLWDWGAFNWGKFCLSELDE